MVNLFEKIMIEVPVGKVLFNGQEVFIDYIRYSNLIVDKYETIKPTLIAINDKNNVFLGVLNSKELEFESVPVELLIRKNYSYVFINEYNDYIQRKISHTCSSFTIDMINNKVSFNYGVVDTIFNKRLKETYSERDFIAR